jgi:hypothetical protein
MVSNALLKSSIIRSLLLKSPHGVMYDDYELALTIMSSIEPL